MVLPRVSKSSETLYLTASMNNNFALYCWKRRGLLVVFPGVTLWKKRSQRYPFRFRSFFSLVSFYLIIFCFLYCQCVCFFLTSLYMIALHFRPIYSNSVAPDYFYYSMLVYMYNGKIEIKFYPGKTTSEKNDVALSSAIGVVIRAEVDLGKHINGWDDVKAETKEYIMARIKVS